MQHHLKLKRDTDDKKRIWITPKDIFFNIWAPKTKCQGRVIVFELVVTSETEVYGLKHGRNDFKR